MFWKTTLKKTRRGARLASRLENLKIFFWEDDCLETASWTLSMRLLVDMERKADKNAHMHTALVSQTHACACIVLVAGTERSFIRGTDA